MKDKKYSILVPNGLHMTREVKGESRIIITEAHIQIQRRDIDRCRYDVLISLPLTYGIIEL